MVTGDFLGKIKIYHASTLNQIVCLNSHVKMITTLTTSPLTGDIISGSEDTYLNFW